MPSTASRQAGATVHHRQRRARIQQPHRLPRVRRTRWPASRPASRSSVPWRCPRAASAWASSASSARTTPRSASPVSSKAIEGRQGHRRWSTCAVTTSISPRRAAMSTTCWSAKPDINCMVGFYSYNPPKIYEALKAANKVGKPSRSIAFDEDPITLGAVKDGSLCRHRGAAALRVGLPGHEADGQAYLEGDKSGDPGRTSSSSCRPSRARQGSNVDAFTANLKAKIAGLIPSLSRQQRVSGPAPPVPCFLCMRSVGC